MVQANHSSSSPEIYYAIQEEEDGHVCADVFGGIE